MMKLRQLIPGVIGLLLYLFLAPVLLFIAAGTLDWPQAWVYVILALVSSITSRLIVLRRNPDTLRERSRFVTAEGTQPWDRFLMAVSALIGPIAVLIVGGLDYRYQLSPQVPLAIQVLAGLVIAIGYIFAAWAMVSNPYFSAVARIQADRGQMVVDDGPYRYVRHPAYSGAIIGMFALPFLLTTLWALIPVLVTNIAMIIRTALEDRMLRNGLAGYAAYSKKTRFRLIPGIW